jgi:dTDP-4-amino-4,6-dideoxygalactose transaminase
MDLIDLKAQRKRIKATLDANIQKVLAHGNFIMGPEVKELEEKLAAYVGVKHAVSCASGTDALLMALMDRLKAAGIPTAIYCPKPLHLQDRLCRPWASVRSVSCFRTRCRSRFQPADAPVSS